jgi:hypothetical protein
MNSANNTDFYVRQINFANETKPDGKLSISKQCCVEKWTRNGIYDKPCIIVFR